MVKETKRTENESNKRNENEYRQQIYGLHIYRLTRKDQLGIFIVCALIT